ncbi:MAG: hypothetical protein O3B73_18030 [bacterium]|nr:hypothetical protein [bacterium]
MVRYFRVILVCVGIVGCGKIPAQPQGPKDAVSEPSILSLPPVFRSAAVSEVTLEDLTDSVQGRLYPDWVRAQRFQYQNQLISGYVIDYGSPVALLLQHDRAFGPESAIRLDNDAPLLRRFNARFSVEVDGRPSLYLIGGRYAVYVTVTPDPDHPEVARYLALLFAEQVVALNPETLVPPTYAVGLSLAAPPVPQWGAVSLSGDDLVVYIELDYALHHVNKGQITLTLQRDVPFARREKVVEVSQGTGRVAFVDTLAYVPDIPDTGAVVLARFTLSPPFIDNLFFSPFAAEYGEDMGGGLFRHTATYSASYRLSR